MRPEDERRALAPGIDEVGAGSPTERESAGSEPHPILEVRDLTKRFPGVLALDGVSLRIFPGEVRALVGENGAGKSTLMKVLGGVHRADAGEVLLDDGPYAPTGPSDAQAHGVSLIHQELNLVPDLTVAQNIYLGREPMSGRSPFLSERSAATRAKRILDSIGVHIDPNAKVRDLTVANQQMVEIAKALAFEARILVMDEPTAALSEKEVAQLFSLIRDFLSPRTAVIYISHRMHEIWEISSRITIFRDGRFVGEVDTASTSRAQVIRMMVGRELSAEAAPRSAPELGSPSLEVRGVCTSLLKNVSFAAHSGEILAFAGLVGAGRTELARAIIGEDPIDAGTVLLEGSEVRIKTPADAVRHGIGYLSEDRKQYGLVLDQSIGWNIALPSMERLRGRGRLIDEKAIRRNTESYIETLAIKTPGASQLARNLSGGNQQKVVLAKWLLRDSEILIFDEPTRGIDIGAKQEIYNLLDDLASQGRTIIVISSELDEVLRVADRVIVMCNGAITGELPRSEATQESIMEFATAFESVSSEGARS